MEIIIPKKFSQMDRKEIKEAIRFASGFLFTKRMDANLHFTVRHLGKKCVKEGDTGNITAEFDIYRPRDFIIRLKNGMNKRTTLLTIFHEMVHANQFVTKRLKSRKGEFVWRDEMVDSESEYNLQPHEVEANEGEVVLYNLWLHVRQNCV